MLWNWDTIDACFLTESWHIENDAMFAATCIGVILLVVLVEFFRRLGKEYESFLTRQARRQAAAYRVVSPSSRACLGAPSEEALESYQQTVTVRVTMVQQAIRALIHAVTFAGAYITMLLAMYYNGYVIICIFIGAALGKFLCDWMVVKVDLREIEDDGNTKRSSRIEQTTTVCCD
jgi:solute carrier family 31 (copper transporter), member 1